MLRAESIELGREVLGGSRRGVPHAFMVTSESALILTLQTPEAARLSTGTQANRRLMRPTRGGHRIWIASGQLPSAIPTP